jgi:hypothetical protein
LHDFYLDIAQEFDAAGLGVFLIGGQACLCYRLPCFDLDADWIIRPAKACIVLSTISEIASSFDGFHAGYSKRYGAPLHEDWLAHGWTSHIFIADRS